MAADVAPNTTSTEFNMNGPSTHADSPMHSPKSMTAAISHDDVPEMAVPPSYPSPSTGNMGVNAGPFFSQQALPSSDNFQLSGNDGHGQMRMMTSSDSDMAVQLQGGREAEQGSSPTEQFGAGEGDPNDQGADPTMAPRKRSKVSRACDECRRKKIRCDATSESGPDQCSSCKRVGSRCQFSRIPMKRGPSKGYIKELADRLNTLENSMQTGDMQSMPMYDDGTSPRGDEEFSPSSSIGGANSRLRKRTHSASNELQSSSYGSGMPQRPSIGAWPPQDIPRHLPHPSSIPNSQTPQSTASIADPNSTSGIYRPQFSPNGVAQPFWRQNPSDIRRSSLANPYEPSDTRSSEQNTSDAILEWDEKTIDKYYSFVHPTLPLLSDSKSRLRSRLANCPVTLREAFLEALYACIRSYPSSGLPQLDPQSARKAVDLITASQFENAATRTISTNLILLQTIILMALAADNHGSAIMQSQLGSPRSVWLGMAVGLAYHLKMQVNRRAEKHSSGDPDSDAKLARRIWWTLIIIDRWNACSTSNPVLISDDSVVLLPEDRSLLGESSYNLARLSCIIGHLADLFVSHASVLPPASSSAPLVSKLLRGELARFTEPLSATLPSFELLQLAVNHVKLLITRHAPSAEPLDLIPLAMLMVTLLSRPTGPVSPPLDHHFTALTALTLVELVDCPETREEAWKGLKDLHSLIRARRLSQTVIEGPPCQGWDVAIGDAIGKKLQLLSAGEGGHGALQHLAETAIGKGEGGGWDPSAITQLGYLNVVGDGMRELLG